MCACVCVCVCVCERERERERERDCLYYIIVHTYDVQLHSLKTLDMDE